MRFSATNSPPSLAEVCKLAWHTFYGMQKAAEDFENLRFEVWTIAISLDSLHSVGTTSLLIERQPDRARWALTFSKILTSLGGALRPLYNLVKLYLSSSSKDRASVREWLTNREMTFEGLTIQDFRRKLSMLVESLNVFLSCLTHAELARARDVAESEEYRVLSEVTKNVLHKWDQDMGIGLRGRQQQQQQQDISRVAQPIEPVGFVNDDVKSYMMPLLNSAMSETGGSETPKPLYSPMPRAQPFGIGAQQVSSSHPQGVMNLDDIESGFRSHMHAMRRIREQLRQQKVDKDHLTHQRSSHFPDDPGHHQHHQHGGGGGGQASSDISGDFADGSSIGSGGGGSGNSMPNSETGSVISNYQGTGGNIGSLSQSEAAAIAMKLQPTTPRLQQSMLGEFRKPTKKRPRYRFRTGLEPAESSDGEDGWGDDDEGGSLARGKTPLEEMLTTVLFFDN